ncbi:MAG: HDIG domain-containing protein [Anaerolineae bacterium]|nr:HDIG domain-containing protein [Anaerolineae bacterium]
MARYRGARSRRRWARILKQFLFWLWITAATSVVTYFSVVGEYDLAVGDVTPQSIPAPRDVTFISEILSEQARDDAARRVTAIYTAPDPTIAREQYNRARDVLAYLRAVRADTYASETQRIRAIWAVPELADLPESSASRILSLPDASWNRVQLEFLDLLDEVMRQEEIRESDLLAIQRRIPTLVPLDLPQDEAEVVEDLVVQFVRPNAFYDEEATEAAREAARESVGPGVRQFRSGEIIVREGAVISQLDIEALEELGLTATTQDSQSRLWVAPLAAVGTFALGLLVRRHDPKALDAGKKQVLISTIATIFLGLAWLLVRAGDVIPYLFPGAAAAMILSTTVGLGPAVATTLLLGAVAGWLSARSLSFAVMVVLGGLFAVLTLPRYEQTGPLFRSGLLAGIVQAVAVFVFSYDELAVSPIGLLLKIGVCMIGGLVSGALTIGGLFLLTPIFDLTTTFRLTELSRPNHPLLQRLLREAPATFNHVMMVTSLAEQAAERIGANALLTRVGAYYHDVGKLERPYFFSENQQGLSNPHDRLDPYTSVDVLAGHVRDGLVLAKQYHLPGAVRAFIPEHHGTMRVSFLYQKAVAAAGGVADLVDESQFRYPGPKPQSRETLLVMLADSSEAATRARRPSTPEELDEVVEFIFKQRMDDGQMDECPITMAELDVVKQAYVDLLRGAFHPRAEYPSGQLRKQSASAPTPAASEDDDEITERIGLTQARSKTPSPEAAEVRATAEAPEDTDVPSNGDGADPATKSGASEVADTPTDSPLEEVGQV